MSNQQIFNKIMKDLRGRQNLQVAGKEVPAYFFGPNNYTDLNPFTVHPSDVTVEELLTTKDVYLNPFAKPDSCQIFCLGGSHYEYNKWYEDALESYCVKEACKRCPKINIWDNNTTREQWDTFDKMKEQIAMEFTPWWKH